jgi:hypothetical protein
MTMDSTLPVGGFPPTPPQTSEEEKTPERRMEPSMESYPPVPMYAIANNGLDQGVFHGNEINPHSQPQQVVSNLAPSSLIKGINVLTFSLDLSCTHTILWPR